MCHNNKIEIGDIVHVDFHCAHFTLCHEAEVLYIPCTTGDSWIFKNLQNNQIHYVSEGCTITLLRKKE